MTRTLITQASESLDAEQGLADLLPELFADLEDLGAHHADVVAILADSPLQQGARVLDLGCGKGACLLQLAQTYGTVGLGIDAVSEFAQHARTRAEALGLASSCCFEQGDLKTALATANDYDLVILLAVGDVLGSLEQTIAKLRTAVRAGGLILIDEAYLSTATHRPDWVTDDCHTRSRTVVRLQSHGERVIRERSMDNPEYQAWSQAAAASIAKRAAALALRHPARAELLHGFAARQVRATQDPDRAVTGAMWLLQTPS